jgi:hypothetical protein
LDVERWALGVESSINKLPAKAANLIASGAARARC